MVSYLSSSEVATLSISAKSFSQEERRRRNKRKNEYRISNKEQGFEKFDDVSFVLL